MEENKEKLLLKDEEHFSIFNTKIKEYISRFDDSHSMIFREDLIEIPHSKIVNVSFKDEIGIYQHEFEDKILFPSISNRNLISPFNVELNNLNKNESTNNKNVLVIDKATSFNIEIGNSKSRESNLLGSQIKKNEKIKFKAN